MSTQLHQGPAEPRVVGAKKLNNGGVVYELDEPETTSWVRKEKAAFTASFGSSAIMRDRAISVPVEFVPVAHSLDILAEDRRIECNSGLERRCTDVHQVDQTRTEMCDRPESHTLDIQIQD